MRGAALALVLGLALALGGCTAPQPSDPQIFQAHLNWLKALSSWRTSGRVAVDMPKDSFSANMRWRQDDAAYHIWLGGPFGQGAVRIDGNAQGVVLRTAEGRELRAASPEALVASELGLDMPISLLQDWILGRPADGEAVVAMELDWAGRLAVLEQAGWRVDYQDYTEMGDGALPSRLVVQREGVRARFILSRWQPGA